MVGRRLLTLLTLATATTALAAVPAPVCRPGSSADHACCRSHGQQAPESQGVACNHDGSTSSAAASFTCHCAHEPATPAEQTTPPAQVHLSTHGVHATSDAVAGATVPEGPVHARPLRVREAAGPPLFTLACALLI